MKFRDRSILPTLAAYKPQCHHSSRSWLAYESSSSEIRLINFHPEGTIKAQHIIQVGNQQVVAVRVLFDPQTEAPYVGVMCPNVFQIFKVASVIVQYSLTFSCNIADYTQGFTAAEAIYDGKQGYFVFATALGKIVTCPVENTNKKTIIDLQLKSRVSSLTAREGYAYLGMQQGTISKVDLNLKKVVGMYDTSSKLPLFSLVIVQDHLMVGTCNGQIHIMNLSFDKTRFLQAHDSIVTLMAADGKNLVTVDDNCTLRKWRIDESWCLESAGSEQHCSKPNLLFTIYGKLYLNFYEQNQIRQI